MPRYIDAEILEHKFIEWRADLKKKKETAKTQREAKRTSDIAAGVVCCLMELRDAPTADVQEIKHGRWIHVAGMNSKCSCCGNYFPAKEFEQRPFDVNYCIWCGARIDGEKNDS